MRNNTPREFRAKILHHQNVLLWPLASSPILLDIFHTTPRRHDGDRDKLFKTNLLRHRLKSKCPVVCSSLHLFLQMLCKLYPPCRRPNFQV